MEAVILSLCCRISKQISEFFVRPPNLKKFSEPQIGVFAWKSHSNP